MYAPLAPCWHCGGRPARIRSFDYWTIECGRCGVRGPRAVFLAWATRWWNNLERRRVA